MKFFSPVILASLASLVNAASIQRSTPLDVHLKRVSNSEVQVSVTNTGSKDLKFLNRGTLLDSLHTQKVHVFSGGSKVPFKGVHVFPHLSNVQDDALTLIKAGQTIDMKVDVASVHDIKGGSYTLVSHGAIPYAEVGSKKLSNVVRFKSNKLDMDVDGAQAARVAKPYTPRYRRSAVQSDCSGSEYDATVAALSACVGIAGDASTAARTGDVSKFEEYWHTDDQSIRDTVADRLSAVSNECSGSTNGSTTYHCTDVIGNGCASNVLAYTLPSDNVVVNCPLYFSDLPATPEQCHGQDQATTTLHEFTHADGVYSPGTADNAYGYDACIALDTDDAVLNADTYALFGNAINVGC